ncbi:MAG: epimerase [Chloroflexi bacterium HGW-Chloroflexi-6]|nr:MAG: epimerase [Chloroflexi bacterium HGW-Chloroflexi-6]
MNILIIGGTRFLGRHLVDSALARGHQLTLFNRGKSNRTLFPTLETIIGNRKHDLGQLTSRSFDAVIDTCGYFPRNVRLAAQTLKDVVKSYVFISSISAYADVSQIGITEDSPLASMPDETVEEINGETYGPLKVLCEKAVQAEFTDRALIIRPGLIVGPYDPTDRFTYWPVRVARGGDVLAPEAPNVPVQIIDGRDLAEFTIKLIEQKAAGTYNVTGPDYELTFGAMLETCKQVSDSDAVFHWASVEFLEQNKVAAWSDMPVWVPNTPENAGFSKVDISKAIAAGLTFRPLANTVRDSIEWAKTRSAEYAWQAGLTAERESELVKLMRET